MRKFFLLLFIVASHLVLAQEDELSDLNKKFLIAKTDLGKVIALKSLLDYYNSNAMSDSAKSCLGIINSIADESNEADVKTEAFLANGLYWYGLVTIGENEQFLKGQQYFGLALESARNSKDKKREGWAHFSLAYSWDKGPEGNSNRGFDNAQKALNIAEEINDDSLYVFSCIRIALIYGNADKNYVQAYINLDKALMRAIEVDDPSLIRAVYNRLINLYTTLNNQEGILLTINNLVQLTKDHYNAGWEIEDLKYRGFYMREKALGAFNYKEALAGIPRVNLYNNEEVIRSSGLLVKAFNLLKSSRLGLNYRNEPVMTNLFWNYFWLNEPQKIDALINPDNALMKSWIIRQGNNFNIFKAARFYMAHQLDSSIYYLDLCRENGGESRDMFKTYFLVLIKKANTDNIISLLEDAKKYYTRRKYSDEIQGVLLCLDSLYKQKGDFRQSSLCLQQYIHLEDSLKKINTEKQISLLEVNNAEKLLQKQKVKEEEKRSRRHNLQYIGIVIGIVVLFVVLAVLGLYHVSHRTIRVLGFFSFLLFFEFLFLVFKKQFYFFTKGEPLKELFIMILLAAILIPLHHWIEHKVIHYLTRHRKVNTK